MVFLVFLVLIRTYDCLWHPRSRVSLVSYTCGLWSLVSLVAYHTVLCISDKHSL